MFLLIHSFPQVYILKQLRVNWSLRFQLVQKLANIYTRTVVISTSYLHPCEQTWGGFWFGRFWGLEFTGGVELNFNASVGRSVESSGRFMSGTASPIHGSDFWCVASANLRAIPTDGGSHGGYRKHGWESPDQTGGFRDQPSRDGAILDFRV